MSNGRGALEFHTVPESKGTSLEVSLQHPRYPPTFAEVDSDNLPFEAVLAEGMTEQVLEVTASVSG